MKSLAKKVAVLPILTIFFLSGCNWKGSCSGCSCCACQNECNVGVQQNVDVESEIADTQKGNILAKQKSDSGLEWKILQEGTGESPEVGKTVVVHYTGWLDEDGQPGKKFDSSVDRGQPFSFRIGVGMVIRGWDEGVMDMKVGEKRRLFIPTDLGYGSHGAGHVIPPNAGLIFDVELISIG